MLTAEHKVKRVERCRQHVDLAEGWNSVVFTDEKKFNLDGPDGCQFYWHDIRQEDQGFYSRQTGDSRVMVWVGFFSKGQTKIAFLECRQDSAKYIYTLSEFLLPFAHLHHGSDFKLQQDNASAHVSKETKKFLEEMSIDAMLWPAKSPDLKPIENLRGILVRSVYAGGRQYELVVELLSVIEREWGNIPHSTIMSLVGSIKKRCIQVLERRGKKTLY